jgi:hypothetical protein
MPVVVLLFTALLGAFLSIWLNLRILRRKTQKWKGGNLVALFVFSLGSFRTKQSELWTQQGFTDDEARMILRQQLFCLFELPVGFVVGCVLSILLVR